ncbi:hypothetical protein BDN70DRAFT_871855 [Pholiota conissans]|uniref:Knr4/Smi1-like domain-containing protein n=1 Tax=Pholiota conissans TaxID=109636 RepID=A0A9P5ZB91_9AGAR|nr:hypothetical protein BDN70DRAFT_871855 [Pholiota conissans]
MGWLSSLFSSFDSSQSSRKGQIFSSTHEAFSLPTSSPVTNAHPDAFNPDTLNTPDPESARSGAYTYPPQGPNAYGYTPPPSAFGSRPTSLLPTHMDQLHTPFSVNSNYPPLAKTWGRITAWLAREYPELGDTLNYGILPEDLAQIEMQFGFALPAVVRESYLCVDGQEAESSAGCSEGLFFGLTLLPLESVLEEWRFWREVDDDPNTGANAALRQSQQSLPPNWIRKEYSQRGWIPLIADKAGNYLGVDLNPAESGSVGQVIVFGRDFDTKVVLWQGDGITGWAKWLASFAEELESGEGFEFGSADTSEGSEDEVGYGSYFYDGNGRGQGDSGGEVGLGLRYTGEYRGWNVLEAWADRSLRKWHEAGVISDSTLEPIQEELAKSEAHTDLDIVELAIDGPATEVPIPLLNSIDDTPLQPKAGPSKQHARSQQSTPALPTISVTKPPAPLPVALPTALDIVPVSSPESERFEDIESGRIRESEDMGLVSATRKTRNDKSPIRRETSEASASDLLPPPTPPEPATTPLASTSSLPQPIVADLLADEPLEILSNATQPPEDTSSSAFVLGDDTIPDTTIRLIGGGGQAGIASPAPEELEESAQPAEPAVAAVGQDSDVASVTSSAAEAGKMGGEKTHKKSKSSLALKRLSQLGGLRKKSDSISSAKEVVPPPVK